MKMSKEVILIKATTGAGQIKLQHCHILMNWTPNFWSKQEKWKRKLFISNFILVCLVEVAKTIFIKSANWIRKSKSLELDSVYWMIILESGCHILKRMKMFLAKHSLIQINDFSFPLDKHGRKFIFPCFIVCIFLKQL